MRLPAEKWSSSQPDDGRLARVLLNPWFLVTAIAVLLLGISLQTSRFGDEAIWAYSSWLWAVHDAPPYVGSFENKPAAIFLLYRLCYELFGLSYLPVRILSSAALMGTLPMLYAIGRSYYGRMAGAMAVLIFGLTHDPQHDRRTAPGADRNLHDLLHHRGGLPAVLAAWERFSAKTKMALVWRRCGSGRRPQFQTGCAVRRDRIDSALRVYGATGERLEAFRFAGRPGRVLRRFSGHRTERPAAACCRGNAARLLERSMGNPAASKHEFVRSPGASSFPCLNG